MQEDKNKIEAILFTIGRSVDTEELGRLTEIGSAGYLNQLLNELAKEYEEKNNALCVVKENNKWRLNIKKEYLHLTEKLLTDSELDRPIQETLAIIAYRQPAIQADVVNIRGNKSYDHIKILKDNGFLSSEKFGRTKILKLTQKFYDYFDVVEENLRDKLTGKEIKKEEVMDREEVKDKDG